MGQQSSARPTSPICALQGHGCVRKLALDLELLIIVQNHQEQRVAGQTLQTISISEQTMPPRDGFESLPGAELGEPRHPCVPSGFRSVQVAPGFGRECRVVLNASRLVWLWGTLGRRTRMCCCHMSRIWFGDVDAPPPPLLPHHSLPLCCLLVLHAPMAITFSSSSRKWERPAACTAGCLSLALPFLLFWLQRACPPDFHSLTAVFLILCLPCGWGLAF